MSFVFEPLKLVLLFIKIPNAMFSLALAIKIKRLSSYILNHLFYLAFLSWSIYISLDGILYVIAPNNQVTYVLANIMRDASLFMLAFIPMCFIQGGFVIKEGEETAVFAKKGRLFITFLISFSLALINLLTDTILVVDKTTKLPIDPAYLPPSGNFTVTFDSISLLGKFSSLMILVFVGWYVISVVLMFIQQTRESGIRKKRSRFIMLGMLMIPVGICYFILLPYILPTFQALATTDLRPYSNLIGQLIWAMSPTLVYFGMRLKIPAFKEETSVEAHHA